MDNVSSSVGHISEGTKHDTATLGGEGVPV
jgi:hypothetical protein